jgi:hypothetical protein
MTVQDFDRAILALACWYEAGDGNIDTMLCIAHTINNLAKKEEIGIGEAVVEHRKLHGIDTHDNVYPDERDPRVTRLLQRIDDVGSPYSVDLTNGAIYYIDLGKSVPEHMGFLLKHPDEHPMCAISGGMHFFK